MILSTEWPSRFLQRCAVISRCSRASLSYTQRSCCLVALAFGEWWRSSSFASPSADARRRSSSGCGLWGGSPFPRSRRWRSATRQAPTLSCRGRSFRKARREEQAYPKDPDPLGVNTLNYAVFWIIYIKNILNKVSVSYCVGNSIRQPQTTLDNFKSLGIPSIRQP